MANTGTEIVMDALREIAVLDPVEAVEGEMLGHALRVGSDLVDAWMSQRQMISGVVISTFTLKAQQDHTIGPSGDLNITPRPVTIESWSAIPDNDAANPQELLMGRPLTWEEYQDIPVKSTTATFPTKMYYDRQHGSTGLGTCSFYPVPDNTDVDIKIYAGKAAITSLVAATSYNLAPGYAQCLKLNLALRLAPAYEKAQVSQLLVEDARTSLKWVKTSNYRPIEQQIRPDFQLRHGYGRGYNLKVDR